MDDISGDSNRLLIAEIASCRSLTFLSTLTFPLTHLRCLAVEKRLSLPVTKIAKIPRKMAPRRIRRGLERRGFSRADNRTYSPSPGGAQHRLRPIEHSERSAT